MAHQRENRWIVNVSNHCNLKCKHCYNFGGSTIGDLHLEKIKKEILAGKNNGCTIIDFFGGEPTIEPYFFELLAFLAEHDLKLRLSTNGLKFLQPKFVAKIKQAGVLDTVQIAFFSLDDQVASYIAHLPGYTLKTIRVITILKKLGVNIDIIYILNALNTTTLVNDVRFLVEQLGMKRFFFSFLEFAGRATDYPELFCSYQAYQQPLLTALRYLQTRQQQDPNIAFVWGKGPYCVLSEFKENYYGVDAKTKDAYAKSTFCSHCFAQNFCDGITREYEHAYNIDEFLHNNVTKELFPLFIRGSDIHYIQDKKILEKIYFDETGMQTIVAKDDDLAEIMQHAKHAYIPYVYNADADQQIDVFGETAHVQLPRLDNTFSMSATDFITSIKEHTQVDSYDYLLTHGAREPLYLLFTLLLKHNRHCIVPDPAWPGYSFVIEQNRGCMHTIPVSVTGDCQWDLLFAQIKKIKPSFVLLANPSFPLGHYFDNDKLRALAALCEELGVYVVIDEIYYDMSLTEKKPNKFYQDSYFKNIIVIYSYTKVCAAPYNKLGYIMADPVITQRITALKELYGFKTYQKNIDVMYQLFFHHKAWRNNMMATIKDNFQAIILQHNLALTLPQAGYCLTIPRPVPKAIPFTNVAKSTIFKDHFIIYG